MKNKQNNTKTNPSKPKEDKPETDRRSFTHEDFDPARMEADACPVRECDEPLTTAPYLWQNGGGRAKTLALPWCGRHGIRLHRKSRTFAYWHGEAREDAAEAALRNFPVETELARARVLGNADKADLTQLPNENSEDAVTWNALAGLLRAGILRETTERLAGCPVDGAPELYMWGSRVSLDRKADRGLYPPLREAREAMEHGVRRYHTEPDAMLVVPGKLVVCIEAKFTSGNTLARNERPRPGEKPKDAAGLLRRYFSENDYWKGKDSCVDMEGMDPARFHGQLFRNVVFAAAMAGRMGADWRVVNLASATQWRGRNAGAGEDFTDPTNGVRAWLKGANKERFAFRTWEDLHAALAREPRAASVARYLEGKSARFVRAFEFSSGRG
jgi:hypothetical protein